MQSFTPGQANTVHADMVSKTSGGPIAAGTVNFYLVALNGTNSGKWFRGSDSTWQATESVAVAGTHAADGHWTATVPADAWVAQGRYMLYAKESGDLHISVAEEVVDD